MKIVKYTDIDPVEFNNEIAMGIKARVLIGKNDGAENFCMRIFKIAENGYTPRHTHEWEHEMFIQSGTGKVLDGNEWRPVTSGTSVFIPGNVEHQIKNSGTEPLILLCIIPSGAPEL